jgi:hypothetical protein
MRLVTVPADRTASIRELRAGLILGLLSGVELSLPKMSGNDYVARIKAIGGSAKVSSAAAGLETGEFQSDLDSPDAVGNGDGSTVNFDLASANTALVAVFVNAVLQPRTAWSVSAGAGTAGVDRLVFATAPANTHAIVAHYLLKTVADVTLRPGESREYTWDNTLGIWLLTGRAAVPSTVRAGSLEPALVGTGDGAVVNFDLPAANIAQVVVAVAGAVQPPAAFSISAGAGTGGVDRLVMGTAPTSGQPVVVYYTLKTSR